MGTIVALPSDDAFRLAVELFEAFDVLDDRFDSAVRPKCGCNTAKLIWLTLYQFAKTLASIAATLAMMA